MTTRRPRYSAEETARRGDDLYEREIRRQVEPTHRGKVVAVDIDRGDYVIADNALAASELLLAQHPDAEIWCVRVGSRMLHRMGGRSTSQSSAEEDIAEIRRLSGRGHSKGWRFNRDEIHER